MNTEACFEPSHARAAPSAARFPGVVSPSGVSTPITGGRIRHDLGEALDHEALDEEAVLEHDHDPSGLRPVETEHPHVRTRRGQSTRSDTLTISTLKLRFGPEKSTCSPGLLPMMSLPSGDESDSTS